MGTSGLVGFAYKGALKVRYNNMDSYPSELGQHVVDFCKNMESLKKETGSTGWAVLKDNVQALELVDPSKTPTALQVDDCKARGFFDGTVNSGKEEWYNLLRNTQGADGLERVFEGELPYWTDDSEFAKESMYCEFAYVLDLDNMTLDVFKGYQTEPQEGNPFGTEPHQDVYDNGQKGEVWYPVRCLASYPLGKIPANWAEVFEEESESAEASTTTRIENTNGKHNKFWQITDNNDGTHLAEWGAIGQTPRNKTYPSNIAMMKLEEKLNDGYVNVA